MALPLSIPTVTDDDLITFHQHAFGIAPPPNALPHFPTSPVNDTHDSHHTQHTAANNDVGEDGLGYYPSGAKRTLTDQQIAMFRHSEIYGIIRARQVKRENEEFDSEQVADEISAAEASSSKDGTPAAPVHAKEESSVAAVTGGRVGEGSSRNKRRKLNRQRSTQASGQDVPSRRVIREMDNVGGGDEGELDY